MYRRFAFVRQEDLFFSQLTVQETLSIAAELQLPNLSSVEEKDEYVNNLLFKLGLVRIIWFLSLGNTTLCTQRARCSFCFLLDFSILA